MAYVSFLAVADATEVGISNVPKRAGQVLFPVLNAVLILVSRVFSTGWVGFSSIQHAVEIGVLFTVIERIAVGVVVARIAGLGRVAVGAVDFDTVADAVLVGVGRGRVGEQGQGFVAVVETVAIGIGPLRIGGRDAVNLSGKGRTATGSNALNGVARRGGFGHDAVGSVAETG